MGCCKSRQGRNVQKHERSAERKVQPERRKCSVPATQEEAMELGELVTDEECSQIRENATLAEKVKLLRELVDKKPSKICAINLAGDTLADLELSVNATVEDLDTCICEEANVDKKEFVLWLNWDGKVLSHDKKLREEGVRPEQSILVTVVKSERPRVKDPELDRALFQEAWMGGGNPRTVKALLEQNADPNGYTYSDGDRALHVTAGRGYAAVVKVLLDARADTTARGVGGMTAMQRCSQQSTTYWKGRHPRVQELIRAHEAALP